MVVYGHLDPVLEFRSHLTKSSGSYLDVPVTAKVGTQLTILWWSDPDYSPSSQFMDMAEAGTFNSLVSQPYNFGRGLGTIIKSYLRVKPMQRSVGGKSDV